MTTRGNRPVSRANNVTYLPRPTERDGLLTFRADSDYYFNGQPRMRPTVLAIAAVLALFVLIAVVFIGAISLPTSAPRQKISTLRPLPVYCDRQSLDKGGDCPHT